MRELRYIDKSDWPRGPWDDEPDKVQWQDEATGLVCLAVRTQHSGHWCGYVGVAEGHPAFGVDHDLVDASAHGALTFSSFCREDDKEHGICHVPEPGQPDRVWWLGFDCMHLGDTSPLGFYNGVYRTLEYVKSECADLARQLAG